MGRTTPVLLSQVCGLMLKSKSLPSLRTLTHPRERTLPVAMNQISRPSSGRFLTTKISLKIHLKTRKTARKRRTTKHRLEMEIAHQPSSNVGGTGGLVQHVAMMAVRVTVKA